MESARDHRKQSRTPRRSIVSSRPDSRYFPDKQTQLACQRGIVAYVQKHYADCPFTIKHLQGPGSKEFNQLVTFLLQRIDPAFAFQNKIEDELPALFKLLGCKHSISKNVIVAITAPSSWPLLLVALHWLVEVLEATDELECTPVDSPYGFSPARSMTAYKLFLTGQNYSEEIAEMRACMDRRAQELIAQTARVSDLIAALKQEREELNASEVNLHSLNSDIEFLAQEVESLQNFESLFTRIEAVRSELSFVKSEVEAHQQIVEEKKRVLEELRQVVSTQLYSWEDMNRASCELDTLEEKAQTLRREHEALQQQKWEAQQTLDRLVSQCAVTTRKYMNTAADLLMVPPGAKYSYSYDLRVGFHLQELENDVIKEDRVLQPSNFLEVLQKAQTQFKREIDSNLAQAIEQLRSLTKENSEKTTRYQDLMEALVTLEEQLETVKHDFELDPCNLRLQLDTKQRQYAELNEACEHVAKDWSRINAELALESDRTQDLQKKMKKTTEDFQQAWSEMQRLTSETVKALRGHQRACGDFFDELVQWSEAQLAAYSK